MAFITGHTNPGKTIINIVAPYCMSKLKLNAEQEKAWADYTAVADKNLEAWKPVRRADLEKMTSPERMQTMIDRTKAHEQAVDGSAGCPENLLCDADSGTTENVRQ